MSRCLFFLLLVVSTPLLADTVTRIDQTFMTLADLDGDSRKDVILVNGSNGMVRVGYQTVATNITWAAPRFLGVIDISDITSGDLMGDSADDLAICAPLLNRYLCYELDSATNIPIPIARYAQGTGPTSLLATEMAAKGYEDVLLVSAMNGTAPYWVERLQSQDTNAIVLGKSLIGSAWRHMNPVEYAAGTNGIAIIDRMSPGFLRIYDPDSSGLNHIGSKSIPGLTNANYVTFRSSKTDNAEFVLWESGHASIRTFSWNGTLFSTSIDYDLGAPIESIQIVHNKGIPQLAVVFKNGSSASLFDYAGNGAPEHVQDFYIKMTDVGVGFVPIGPNAMVFIKASSHDVSGRLIVEQFTAESGGFVASGTTQLAAAPASTRHSNVMTFENEPFVNSSPRRLQLLHAGDWVTNVKLTTDIQATSQQDRGSTEGLGNQAEYHLGAVDPAASYTLYSQIDDAIAMYSTDAARGADVVSIQVLPEPGIYGRSVEVSFSVTPAATIYYRFSETNNWTNYSDPFMIFFDTDIQYFAETAYARGIIRSAAYRFNESPSDLDSDGDGIPDYVELAQGMDPLTSGLDADGDGYSDLDELVANSNPTNRADTPIASNRVEQGVCYDHKLYIRPYDGVSNEYAYAYYGTQARLYSADGAQYGYATVAPGAFNASFDAVPTGIRPPFVTFVTEPRYDLHPIVTKGTNNQLGVELIGVSLIPTSSVQTVEYEYQYGDLSTEASNWIAAAQDQWTNETRQSKTTFLAEDDVVTALLVERKFIDILQTRGITTNAWISLFPGRTADSTLPHFTSSDLNAIQSPGPSDEDAYLMGSLIYDLTYAPQTQLRALATDIYDICSDRGRGTNHVGRYPLPVDVLRQFIYNGELQTNYLAATTRTALQQAQAYSEVTQALAQVTSRPRETYTLYVTTDSFERDWPVLYTSEGDAKCLYDADSAAYRFPLTFNLQTGSVVEVEAFTDAIWNDCAGADPLEVITASLIAVPMSVSSDQDGNLLPDDYEAIFLAGGGGTSTSDFDNDGYSDLQEYLDGTDPTDAGDHGIGTPVDFSPPLVNFVVTNQTLAQLEIDWPSDYVDDFVFTAQYTDDLRTDYLEEVQLPQGNLSTPVSLESSNMRFYRFLIRTRPSR